MENRMNALNASSAILGSWYTTPKNYRIQNLLKMYGYGGRDLDNQIFTHSIQEMDSDRDRHYSSKLDVSNCLDNIYGDQHQICAKNGLGHNSEIELGTGPDRYTTECFVLNINKRKFYALSWEEIAEAAENDEFLVKLKSAMMSNRTEKLSELLKDKRIHCSQSKNGLSAIKIEDLSLYRNMIMVRDRIWAPASITFAFFDNLHLGQRSVDMMQRLALRSVYWSGISKDLENRTMDRNKKLDDLPEDETTRAFECI